MRAERRTSGVTTDTHRYVVGRTLSEDLESPHLATSETGTPRLGWVFAGEHPLFRYDPTTNQPVYYLQDGMGSTIGLVASTPTTTSTIHYDGFGAERSTTGTLASLPAASGGDFRFQGMWQDEGTGLYYVRARSYEVESGRFLSRDRADLQRAAPESASQYVFAHNTPALSRDPSGYVSITDVFSATVVTRVLATIAVASFATGFYRGLQGGRDLNDRMGEERLDAFVTCIEENTIDATVGALSLEGVVFLPFSKESWLAEQVMPRIMMFADASPFTSLASAWIFRLRRALHLSIAWGTRARLVARGISNVATPLLIGEGFYDAGLVTACLGVFVR